MASVPGRSGNFAVHQREGKDVYDSSLTYGLPQLVYPPTTATQPPPKPRWSLSCSEKQLYRLIFLPLRT